MKIIIAAALSPWETAQIIQKVRELDRPDRTMFIGIDAPEFNQAHQEAVLDFLDPPLEVVGFSANTMRRRTMAEMGPIVFKSEPSLWAMLAQVNPEGRSVKPFDMRRWDLGDERMYRLSWGHYEAVPDTLEASRVRLLEGRHMSWSPDVKEVSFLNKATGDLLTFEYLGVKFEDWAPGFGFLLLGRRLVPPVEE